MDIQSLSSTVPTAVMPRQQTAVTETSEAKAQGTNQPLLASNAASAPVRAEQLDSAVKAANDFVSGVNHSLLFSVDDETGTSIVKVIDKNTKEVIRQIPSEEMMVIAKALNTIKGLLVHQKA